MFLTLRRFDTVFQDLLVLFVQFERLAEPLVIVVVCDEISEALLQLLKLSLSHNAIRFELLIFCRIFGDSFPELLGSFVNSQPLSLALL